MVKRGIFLLSMAFLPAVGHADPVINGKLSDFFCTAKPFAAATTAEALVERLQRDFGLSIVDRSQKNLYSLTHGTAPIQQVDLEYQSTKRLKMVHFGMTPLDAATLADIKARLDACLKHKAQPGGDPGSWQWKLTGNIYLDLAADQTGASLDASGLDDPGAE